MNKILLLLLVTCACVASKNDQVDSSSTKKIQQENSEYEIRETAPKIKTKDGRQLDVRITWPKISGEIPIMIVAPGGGYHMDGKIFKELALQAPKRGIAVLRFNWSYFTMRDQRLQRGPELAKDLYAVLKFVRNNQKIDSTKIILSGKSMGSVMAYKTSRVNSKGVVGVVLFTPLIDSMRTANSQYRNIDKATLPMIFINGSSDNAYNKNVMDALIKQAINSDCSSMVVEGNHSLKTGKADRDGQNITKAVKFAVDWCANIVR